MDRTLSLADDEPERQRSTTVSVVDVPLIEISVLDRNSAHFVARVRERVVSLSALSWQA